MDRLARNKRWIVYLALFWLCVVVGCALLNHPAYPDSSSGGYIAGQRNSSAPWGRWIGMWNASGGTITDGTVVMVDTATAPTASIPIGKGFTTWNADPANFYRIVGVTLGNTSGNSWGRVLVDGFHNNVLMDSTGTTGYARIRPSLKTAGALHVYTANPDSLNQAKKACGIFGRYAQSGALRGYVFVRMNWLGR